jgi:hypothetical protein
METRAVSPNHRRTRERGQVWVQGCTCSALGVWREVAPDCKPGLSTPLFVVRLWREEAAGGLEYRGSVRDVISDAFRHFRAWPDLTAFLVAQGEEAEGALADEAGGDRHGDGAGAT